MPKYKVGDRVKVRQDLGFWETCTSPSLVQKMQILHITIIEVDLDGDYKAKENNCYYSEYMLYGLCEEGNNG